MPGDCGALYFLDSAEGGERPEVGLRDPGQGVLDGLKEVAGGFEAGAGAMAPFGREVCGSAVGAAGTGGGVVVGGQDVSYIKGESAAIV